jgi:hypothetical protein
MIEIFEPRIAPATFIVSNLADSGAGSLRDAIAGANSHVGPDVITFASGLTGTIGITSGEMQITDTLTIKGPGATKLALDANLQSRFFLVSDGDDAKDSPLTVSGLSFFRGEERTALGAGQRGGAIVSIESLNVKSCVFMENEAVESAGGAVAVLQVPDGVPISVDVRNSTFTSNSSQLFSGGAIAVFVDGSITLRNSLFTGNSAGDLAGGGGAAALRTGVDETLLVQNCQFVGNRAGEAGALRIAGGAEGRAIVRDSLFEDNQALNDNGGAAIISGGTVLIERSAFNQNEAQSQGGGLDVTAFSSLVIRSSQFLDNAVLAPGSGGGGLEISLPDGGDGRIISSVISGNTAPQGGGVQVTETPGKLQIIGSQITSNLAATNGGGILVLEDIDTHQSADLSIIRSQLIGNIAVDGDGGGVATFGDGEFTMLFSQVIQNSARGAGGGLSLFTPSPASIIGSIIAQNRTEEQGGGIFALSPLELIATRILGNSAGEGGGIRAFNDLALHFSMVSGNSATVGGGIFHAIGTELLLMASRVTGNFSPDGQQIVEG